MTASSATLRRLFRDIMRFAMLSGLCWLLDLSLLVILSVALGWHPASANVASSLVAAAVVYAVAHRRIHKGLPQAQNLRLLVYLGYTLGVITLASWLLSELHLWLSTFFSSPVSTLLWAKVMVTPPQLASNFVVSRVLARVSLRTARST